MKRTLIIAEAGVNYNGRIDLAKKMVRVAAEAGADIVKFQTGIPEEVISVFAVKADYQKTNTGDEKGEESQLEMSRKLMLPWDVYPELIECCNENHIEFLSTPFDIPSVKFLHDLGVRTWKIPSGEITNLPLLEYVGNLGESVILSTGMSTIEEIEEAVTILSSGGSRITLLHCNTEYPTPFEDANIKAMETLRMRFNLPVGYSDHTLGIEACIGAVALGAEVIEKHFTLDKNMDGPDQIASADPEELRKLIQSVRNMELALGSGVKNPSASEKKNMVIARKSIVAKRKIKAGELFSMDNLACKRPGDGISPMKIHEIIGQKAIRDFDYDEQIEL